MYAIGLDIGGTKVAVGLINEYGYCVHQVTVPSVPEDSESMFQQVRTCIERLLEEQRVSTHSVVGLGIGVPGKLDREKGIAVMQANLPWRNFPLISRLKELYPWPMILEHDVGVAAYGEWSQGKKSPDETFTYVTISTGISSCTIHRGEIIRGAGFSGEIGQAFFSDDKRRLEQQAAGPAIQRLAEERGLNADQLIRGYLGEEKDFDPLDSWARALYAIICLLDPHRIVLGGGVIQHHPELLEKVKERLHTYVLPEQKVALDRMDVSSLGGLSGCVGAGMMIWDQKRALLQKGGTQ